MKQVASLLLFGMTLSLAGLLGARVGNAEDTAPKVQYFTAAQLASQVAHPVDGVAAKQFLNGPGGSVYIVHRNKNGEAEVHTALNDIFVVKSGHAKITVGGRVTGNREDRSRPNGAAARSREVPIIRWRRGTSCSSPPACRTRSWFRPKPRSPMSR